MWYNLKQKLTRWSGKTLKQGKLIDNLKEDLSAGYTRYLAYLKNGAIVVVDKVSEQGGKRFAVGHGPFDRKYYFDDYGRCITIHHLDKFPFPTPDDHIAKLVREPKQEYLE